MNYCILHLLLAPLFIGRIIIAYFKLKMKVSDLNSLEYLLQIVEIFFKFDLIINQRKESNICNQEILDQILMSL